MEELQDAIEDAQYVNAIATQEVGPRPVLPWLKPTEDQLQQWIAAKKPQLDNLDWILSHAIGFFLFSQYIKSQENEYTRINFCEEVMRFLKLPERGRAGKAAFIQVQYLQLADHQGSERPYSLSADNKSEIVESDLARVLPKQELSQKEIDKLLDISMDWPNSTESIVGLKGPVLKEVMQDLQEIQEINNISHMRGSVRNNTAASSLSYHGNDDSSPQSDDVSSSHDTTETSASSSTSQANSNATTTKPSRAANSKAHSASMHEVSRRKVIGAMKTKMNAEVRPAENIFLNAEQVVMESLKRDYWSGFRESDLFVKFRNFMWYQDRRVVPEDFFTMRVLGRGGFGLVYGASNIILPSLLVTLFVVSSSLFQTMLFQQAKRGLRESYTP